MKTLSIQGSRGRSDIHVGESLDRVEHYIPAGRRTIIITDSVVRDLYGERAGNCPLYRDGKKEMKQLADQLDHLYRRVAKRFTENKAVTIKREGEYERISLRRQHKLHESILMSFWEDCGGTTSVPAPICRPCRCDWKLSLPVKVFW